MFFSRVESFLFSRIWENGKVFPIHFTYSILSAKSWFPLTVLRYRSVFFSFKPTWSPKETSLKGSLNFYPMKPFFIKCILLSVDICIFSLLTMVQGLIGLLPLIILGCRAGSHTDAHFQSGSLPYFMVFQHRFSNRGLGRGSAHPYFTLKRSIITVCDHYWLLGQLCFEASGHLLSFLLLFPS